MQAGRQGEDAMTAAQAEARVTPEEYLARERRAQTKSEYLGGFVVAMSGASRLHNYVVGDIFGELRDQLRDSPCDLFTSDMRVKVTETGDYTYPDVIVACGEVEFEDAELDTLLTPTVIIEVLSPSTERYDRGLKFTSYRQLPTLQEYVLVAQDRPSVEHYARHGEQWVLTTITDLDASVRLPAIGCELRLREIYRRVNVEAQSNSEPNQGQPRG
jgi:Uma2 family endonuclease